MDAGHNSILDQLGIRNGEYKGGAYTEYAVSLVLEDYNKMINVTRVLYPEVAEHFGTTPSCVERDMRMVVQKAWERNPDLLCEWAGYPLKRKPPVTRFIAILAEYCERNGIEV